MRVGFDTGIATDVANSAGHFYIDKRSTIPAGDLYYPEMQTLPKGYFTTLTNGKEGFSFIDNSTCEYEANKDGRLFITLFRGVRNIICTEFRSAGAFPHENGGQSLGVLTFDYMLYPFGKVDETSMLAERMSAPTKTIQTSKGVGTNADSASFLEIPEGLVLTAFKKAEDSENFIIRMFNPTEKAIKGKIETTLKNVVVVNMNEEAEGEIDLAKINVGPNKILTIEVEK